MNRKIIGQLFEDSDPLLENKELKLSLKDWKELMARVDQMQAQLMSVDEKMNTMYARVVNWLTRMREKIDFLLVEQKKCEQFINTGFQKWTEKMSDYFQQAEKSGNQDQLMNAMQHHTEFIQNCDNQLQLFKKSFSQNESYIYQLREEMQSLRREVDHMKNKSIDNTLISPIRHKSHFTPPSL